VSAVHAEHRNLHPVNRAQQRAGLVVFSLHAPGFVDREIVYDDDVASPRFASRHFVDIALEGNAIDKTGDN
jgi:hypothetical protein